MDPDANLEEQRKLATKIQQNYDLGNHIDQDDAARLAELVLALDTWLVRDGFLPQRWSAKS